MGLDVSSMIHSQKKILCAEALDGIEKAVIHCGRKSNKRSVRPATESTDLQVYNQIAKILMNRQNDFFEPAAQKDADTFSEYLRDSTDAVDFIDLSDEKKGSLKACAKTLHGYTNRALEENRELLKEERIAISLTFNEAARSCGHDTAGVKMRKDLRLLSANTEILVNISKAYITSIKSAVDAHAKDVEENSMLAKASNEAVRPETSGWGFLFSNFLPWSFLTKEEKK